MNETRATLEEIGISQIQSTQLEHNNVKALCLAILEDAIKCYLSGSQRLSNHASNWLKSESRHFVFTFEVICEILDLDSEAVRQRLKKLKKAGDIYNKNRSFDYAGRKAMRPTTRRIRTKRPGK